jgi:hypothetical protein
MNTARTRSSLILQLESRGFARSLRFGLLAFAVIPQLTNPLRLGSRTALSLRKVNGCCLLRAKALLRRARSA